MNTTTQAEARPIIFITGPTATGKTAAAVALAREIKGGGEVISADSMLVYRGMDIGTAKPSMEERRNIPHHMIDIVAPDESFSAADFQQRAIGLIGEIRGRGRVPIVAGGTGFYINSILYKDSYGFGDVEPDPEYRDHLYEMARERGAERVHDLLKSLDPARAGQIHPQNLKRVVRSLEYIRQTGATFPQNASPREREVIPGAKNYVLTIARDKLYDRIDKRVLKMVESGLVDEVRGLLRAGYGEGLTSMQGLGYKETAAYIKGRLTFDEFVDTLQRNTRHFAKRQMTWFRTQCRGKMIGAEGFRPDAIIKEIAESSLTI
ncbi:MAG: tRNA (adenosine(37)-N6)-dimethylallyltransferase MiaA [Defluviitaleaceae bacterium]|nr:tRNA (adenosine(37)-N6)-dimethylallyltransferase MiaA [Defluviitaleaceae bacterium]